MADAPGSQLRPLRPSYPVRTERLLLRPLTRIVARIDERNEPSVKLARRLGMRQEARLVHNEFFKGEWSTEVDFAMLAEEWYRLARR